MTDIPRRLPRPAPWLFDQEHYYGCKVRLPIDIGGERGVNYTVVDEYEPQDYVDHTGRLVARKWVFTQRVKQYSEPHLTEAEWRECTRCQELGRGYREVPDDERLEVGSE